jgi:hypothetical protein
VTVELANPVIEHLDIAARKQKFPNRDTLNEAEHTVI